MTGPNSLMLTAALSLLGTPLLAAPVASLTAAAPDKSALLIAIAHYDHSPAELKVPDGAPRTGRFEPLLTYGNLKGPNHDVDSMRDLLTGEKFGFPNDERHIHILRDQAATRDGILKAMEKYLVTDPHPGDTVVLYISSHGSLRADPKGRGPVYDLDGTGQHPTAVENTIVPYDWYLGHDDVFSRDLRHIFNLAADRGIHVTAIFDSCHSGSLARGAKSSALISKDFVFDPRPMPEDPFPAEASGTPPERRADNPVVVLSAAQKDQLAIDVADSDPPHGLFTGALIETLNGLPADRPVADVFKRLQVAMELAPRARYQQPVLDTSSARSTEPLFGGTAGSGPPTAAIVSADGSGVVLDIGLGADVGPGSEFTEVTDRDGVRAVLQIVESQGIARSRAKLVGPAGAAVAAKDVVQLSKWVPAPHPPLVFYLGAGSLSAAQLRGAVQAVQAAALKLAADPSADPWTQHLSWNGAQWILQGAQGKPMLLGAQLTTAALKKVPASSSVWFDAPFPTEARGGILAPGEGADPPRTAQLTSDRDSAAYVLGATLVAGEVRYAWFNRSQLDAQLQTPRNFGAGCSPDSAYPLRTDWTATAAAPIALTKSATQLAKLHGWLNLGTSLSAQTDFAYKLKLRRADGTDDIENQGHTYPGTYRLRLVKEGKRPVDSPRWVYVLAIDCQGKSTLLWPDANTPAGQFPTDAGQFEEIELPGSDFDVVEPVGTDTYLLLTTTTPLQNPLALDFDGVVTRGGSKGAVSPLEELLDSTSAGVRGTSKPTPTNWSIQKLQLTSQATQAQ